MSTAQAPRLPVTGSPARWLAVALAGLGVLLLAGALATFVGSAGWGYDFSCYFDAAARLVHGERLYQAQLLSGPFTHGGAGTYVYAPPLAGVLQPLVALGAANATAVWLALRLACLALALWLMPVATPVRLAAFGVSVFGFPLLNDLNLGQVNVLLLLGMAATWRWLDEPAGAVATALTLFLRPQLGLVAAWWAWRRRWRQLAWLIGTGIAVALASLPLVGVGAYADYLRLLSDIRFAGAPNNGSLDAMARALGLADPLPTLLLVAGGVVALVAIVLATRRDREAGFVVTVGASLLASPLLWAHYLVLLTIPAAFLAQRGRPWGLLLPLLGWLPVPWLWVGALAGTLAPLAARGPTTARGVTAPGAALDRPAVLAEQG